MNYSRTIDWMYSKLPMYQRSGEIAYTGKLNNILKFVKHLSYPQRKFKSIHVAGTNGKGSTCHIIASVLQESGLQVGLYTSPHLMDFRERIKLNGKLVSKQFVIQFIKRNRNFIESHFLSFFELTVGMAFDYFNKKEVDIAVIEVGLGGRLDSTNIITPEVAVITNIGLDHTHILGKTLHLIAIEKAGIIKNNIPVVIGETQPEIKSIFINFAKQKKAPIYFADKLGNGNYKTDLKGVYQLKNCRTAVTAIKCLKDVCIKQLHIKRGLKKVVKNTGLIGRWQILKKNPFIVCDTAHNAEGLSYTINQLQRHRPKRMHFVLGFVKDKNLDSIIGLFPRQGIYYLTKPDVPRALEETILKKYFKRFHLQSKCYKLVEEAYNAALKNASKYDAVYVGGSTFVVGDLLEKIK